MATNQTLFSRLEQRSVINFLVVKKCKPCEEECVMRTKKHVFVKKCFKMSKILFSSNESESKRQSME